MRITPLWLPLQKQRSDDDDGCFISRFRRSNMEQALGAILPIQPQIVPSIAHEVPKEKAPKKYWNPAEYAKEYRKAHKEEIEQQKKEKYAEDKGKILAAKMIGYLKHGVVKKPTQKSIELYGLYEDPDSGEWKSRMLEA